MLHESTTVKGVKESKEQLTCSFIVTAIYYPCKLCSGKSHSSLVSFLVELISDQVSLTCFSGISYDALVCLCLFPFNIDCGSVFVPLLSSCTRQTFSLNFSNKSLGSSEETDTFSK